MKQIKNFVVSVVRDNIALLPVDAIVAPQYTEGASWDGVSGDLADNGAYESIKEYARFVKEESVELGDVVMLPAYDACAEHIMHAAVCCLESEVQFEAVQKAVLKVMELAEENDVKRLSIPMLGTGFFGFLTDEQAARAIFSSIAKYAEKSDAEMTIFIVVQSCDIATIREVLEKETYLNTVPEDGARVFDYDAFMEANSDEDED